MNSNVCSHFFHFHPDDDWSIQSKHWQVIFWAQLDNLFCSSQLRSHWKFTACALVMKPQNFKDCIKAPLQRSAVDRHKIGNPPFLCDSLSACTTVCMWCCDHELWSETDKLGIKVLTLWWCVCSSMQWPEWALHHSPPQSLVQFYIEPELDKQFRYPLYSIPHL